MNGLLAQNIQIRNSQKVIYRPNNDKTSDFNLFSDSYITDVAYIDPSSFQCVLKREKLNLPDSKHNKGRSIYLQILFSIIIDDFSLRKIDDT